MKAYILAVAGAVLLSAVVALIAPCGKMGKLAKGAGKLLILGALVAPFVTAIAGGAVFPASDPEEGAPDAAYLEQCARLMEKEDEGEIFDFLRENYGVTARVEVKRAESGYFLREKIAVAILDFGIIGQDEHIDTMSRIKQVLAERYACAVELSDEGAA